MKGKPLAPADGAKPTGSTPEDLEMETVMKLDVRLKRAYLPPSPDDGVRVLVDRLWPRAVRKSDAAIDRWLKEVAPSTELRGWFGHDPDRWEAFGRRYRAELSRNPAPLNELRQAAHGARLTLVYAARDEVHNAAVILGELLTQ